MGWTHDCEVPVVKRGDRFQTEPFSEDHDRFRHDQIGVAVQNGHTAFVFWGRSIRGCDQDVGVKEQHAGSGAFGELLSR